MPPDTRLDIIIRLLAETHGAEAVGQAVENVASTQQRADSTIAKGAQMAAGAKGELRKLLGLLTAEFPLLRIAARSAFSATGAAITGVIVLFKMAKDRLKEWNEEMDAAAKRAAEPFTRTLELQRDALVSNAVALDDLRSKLEKAARGERDFATLQTEAISILQRQEAAIASLAEAEQKHELARLELKHKLGLASEEQYELAKLEITAKYAARKRELEERGLVTEIMMRRRNVEQAELAQSDLSSAAETAINREADAQRELTALMQFKAGQMEREKELKEKVAGYEAKLGPKETERFMRIGAQATAAQARQALWDSGSYSQSGFEAAQGRFAEWSQLSLALTASREAQTRLVEQEMDKQIALQRARTDSSMASSRALGGQEFVTKGQRELQELQTKLSILRQVNSEQRSFEDSERAMREAEIMGGGVPPLPGRGYRGVQANSLGGGAGVPYRGAGARRPRTADEQTDAAVMLGQNRLLLTNAAAGADAILAGNQANQSQLQAINALGQMLGVNAENSRAMLSMIGRFNDSVRELQAGLRRVESRQGYYRDTR